jgi:predicted amidohydrolase YtcJ
LPDTRGHERDEEGHVAPARVAELLALEWLRAYTLRSADAGGQEDERGSITPGKRADLVVLDGDLAGPGVPRVRET